jgi:hypothetical protein
MKLYLKFCSAIYHFYARRDNDPGVYTFWVATVVLTANFLGIYDVVSYFIYPNLPFSSIVVFSLLAISAAVVYLFFILPGKYKEIKPTEKSNMYSIVYIIISILFVILIGSLHRSRNLVLKEKFTSTVINNVGTA